MSTYYKDFCEFIEGHKYRKDCNMKLTHTALAGLNKGAYSFENDAYELFMEKYVNVLKHCSNGNDYLYFVERPNDTTFLFVDIDYNHDCSKRLYNENDIIHTITLLNEIIVKTFDVTEHQMLAYVTEKPQPTCKNKNDVSKDGPHIYYPNLPLSKNQRHYVLNMLIKKMMEESSDGKYHFVDGNQCTTNDIDSIIDTTIVESNGILMIGSHKEGYPSYELTHVYDCEMNDIFEDVDNDVDELVYLLSNQKYDDDSSIAYLSEGIENALSSKYKKQIDMNDIIPKMTSNTNIGKNKANYISKNMGEFTDQHSRDIYFATQLTKILSLKRATEYDTWKRVGFALYAVNEGLYDVFVEFSKKNMQKYRKNTVTCETIWKVAPNYCSNYNIRTLQYWARDDDKDGYCRVIRESFGNLFESMESGRHYDIATLVHQLYKDSYVCVNVEKNKWYKFSDHRWSMDPSALSLGAIISNFISPIISAYASAKLTESSNDYGNGSESKMKKFAKIMATAEKLRDVPFRRNVVDACAALFYDPTFMAKLDSNSYLIGFTNGVYDLKEKCFRNGIPSDYVSKSVGYAYQKFIENDESFAKIDKFFSQVQTEQDMKEYLLTFIASVLRGIPDSKFHIWTGGGGNGKSATVNILKFMFGEYFGILPVTFITSKKKNSSGPTPELADKNGKRLVVIQEPEHNDVVYVSQMKECTGKDTLYARALFGDPFEYVPQFTLILTCNTLPHIPTNDYGTWRRLRVTPFESEFVERDPIGPKQFLIDEELSEEFSSWAPILMAYVIEKYYPKYESGYCGKRFSIKTPDKVTQFTNEYRKDSDSFLEFIDTHLVKSSNDSESIVVIYEAFKEWYMKAYTDKPPARKDFVGYLKRSKYEVDKQNIIGVTFVI